MLPLSDKVKGILFCILIFLGFFAVGFGDNEGIKWLTIAGVVMITAGAIFWLQLWNGQGKRER